jgi:hypothetical protein
MVPGAFPVFPAQMVVNQSLVGPMQHHIWHLTVVHVVALDEVDGQLLIEDFKIKISALPGLKTIAKFTDLANPLGVQNEPGLELVVCGSIFPLALQDFVQKAEHFLPPKFRLADKQVQGVPLIVQNELAGNL